MQELPNIPPIGRLFVNSGSLTTTTTLPTLPTPPTPPAALSNLINNFGEYVFAPVSSQELYFDLGATISTTI